MKLVKSDQYYETTKRATLATLVLQDKVPKYSL